MIGHRLLAHLDPFHGIRLGPYDGAPGVQHDLVLLSGADLPGHGGPDRAGGVGTAGPAEMVMAAGCGV